VYNDAVIVVSIDDNEQANLKLIYADKCLFNKEFLTKYGIFLKKYCVILPVFNTARAFRFLKPESSCFVGTQKLEIQYANDH